MTNFTERMSELANDIIWSAEACTPISIDIVEEYNELVQLGHMSALDYLKTRARIGEGTIDDIYALEDAEDFGEAVRRVNYWSGQHPEDDENG